MVDVGVYADADGTQKMVEERKKCELRRRRASHRRTNTMRTVAAWIGDGGVSGRKRNPSSSARVRHKGTELHRPVAKLCLLEPDAEEEEDTSKKRWKTKRNYERFANCPALGGPSSQTCQAEL